MSRRPNIPSRKLPATPKASPQKAQTATLVQQGLALHQQGKFKEAQSIYEHVLTIQTDNFSALQLLGTLLIQIQQFTKGLDFLNKALKIVPYDAVCHSNRGMGLKALMCFEEALASYDQAISIKPDYAEAHNNRGSVLLELGRSDDALASYDQAIIIKPDYVDAYYNRGNTLQELGRLDEALASYERAISIKQEHAEAHCKRGNTLQVLGRLDEALASYDRAISIKQEHAEAHNNRGNILLALKRSEEALASCGRAISIKPDYAEAYNNCGVALLKLMRLEEALASCDQAISIKPDYAEAYSNRGTILLDLNRADDAIASYDQAINFQPYNPAVHYNRGVALRAIERLEEAIVSYNKAISIKPDYAEAYSNRGNVLQALKFLDEAIVSYDQAIKIKPDYASGHWNLSLCHLLGGNYKNGWQEYEWRWKNEDISSFYNKRNFLQPLWLGTQPLQDKTILLHAEQGLGDTIQFCRYVPLVAQLGAKVILEVQPPLLKLLGNLECVTQVIAKDEILPKFDFQCPLLSLPLAFNTELHSIPPVSPGMASSAEKVSKWQTLLGEKKKPRIGIAWSSASSFKADSRRSITLAQLLSALPNEGFEYICLQKEIKEIDKETLRANPQIQFYGDIFEDFSDTAALIDCVDLVISTCTSIPHLSCSLGKETWLMLAYVADWRWLLDREDSPWYPSAKLYRQEKIGDWASVLNRVRADLSCYK